MGNRPDWVDTNYKKSPTHMMPDKTKMDGVKHMADGGDEEEGFDPGFDISYEATGMGLGDYSGGGRINRNVYRGEDGTLNLGVSGSHWKSGGKSGASLDALDATYRSKEGSEYGIQFEPGTKRVQLTFRKEF